jgi:hypothetical protein
MSALRGVPDFAHASLTYAATSLLRCTQTRFAHLHPDRRRIFAVSRKAAELLAAAATEPDHIAAAQSAFISRLIISRENSTDHNMGKSSGSLTASLRPSESINNRSLQAIDFEAFARTLGTDQSMTPWPPIPIMRQSGSDAIWELAGQPSFTSESLSISPALGAHDTETHR